MNSSFFQTAACGGQSGCVGFEQFVFQNPSSGNGYAYIENFLLYASSCPSGYNDYIVNGHMDGCIESSASVSVPNQSITNLSNFVLTGNAATSGDFVTFSVGTTAYAMKNPQSDSVTDLSTNWDFAQFNVFGLGNGSQAVFNSGSTIVASVQVDDGVIIAPTCDDGTGSGTGTTAESNSLTDVTAPPEIPLSFPALFYEESNAINGGRECSAYGVTKTAFQANSTTKNLYTFSPSSTPVSLGVGMFPKTSPSIAKLSNGEYEIAFQANTGHLWVVSPQGYGTDTGVMMYPGTNPAIAASPNGTFEVAYESDSATKNLYTYSPALGATSLGVGAETGTSPSIAALSSGGYEIAFQANTGVLWVVNPSGYGTNTGLSMMAATNPSIAASPNGGFEVAFQGNSLTKNLYTYSSTTGGSQLALGMSAGTSPAIAALTGGGYEIAFQANTGMLWVVSPNGVGTNTALAMMTGTNPAIVGLPGGSFAEAYQANSSGILNVVTAQGNVSNGNVNSGEAMMSGTSPSIAP